MPVGLIVYEFLQSYYENTKDVLTNTLCIMMSNTLLNYILGHKLELIILIKLCHLPFPFIFNHFYSNQFK